MERNLAVETIEGEIGVVIDYAPGKTAAITLFQAAMDIVQSLDKLDSVLLSSVDTSLEPVSILNDVQHSSLKMLLARALRHVPDELVANLDWKSWIGNLLVKGKYKLLQVLGSDAAEVQGVLYSLRDDYKSPPGQIADFSPPAVSDVMDALDGIARARNSMAGYQVMVQTELGDVLLPDETVIWPLEEPPTPTREVTNSGIELFKIKSPDMLGSAQWTVRRNNRSIKVEVLHSSWLKAYHRREKVILPGDSLKCKFEEKITYDQLGNEIDRTVSIIEILDIITPPLQARLV